MFAKKHIGISCVSGIVRTRGGAGPEPQQPPAMGAGASAPPVPPLPREKAPEAVVWVFAGPDTALSLHPYHLKEEPSKA